MKRAPLFVALLLCAAPAQAASSSQPLGLKLEPSFVLQGNALENSDLGSASKDTRYTFSGQARLKARYRFSPKTDAMIDARAVGISGDSGAEDETGRIAADESYLELRQFWARFRDLSPGLDLQAGRQRVREDYGIWWNDDIESARLLYETQDFKGFAGIAQSFGSYKTSGDDYRAEDEDRFRALGEARWDMNENHALEGRFLYEYDYSDDQNPGRVARYDDLDDEDGKLLWLGARGIGAFKGLLSQTLHYKIDVMGVGGEEDETLSSSIPGTDSRVVTGSRNRDVLGWGMDARGSIEFAGSLKPVLTLGYAFGSGDDGSRTDNSFRQTGLQSNSSALPNGRVYDYGEALRPELSNLHILSAGAGFNLSETADLDLFYHYYLLDENASRLRHSIINAPLNGSEKYLGQEADLILNLDLAHAFGLNETYLKGLTMRNSLGIFQAGDAYGIYEGERALKFFTELYFSF